MNKHYIVFDLEWNQSADGREGTVDGMPFEIIEIGAVKLDEKLKKVSEFSRVVRPQVYKKLHFKVLEIMHVGMEELKTRGEPFPETVRAFLDWAAEAPDGGESTPVFCTWGNMDITELQRNMAYYDIPNPFPYPLLYYDVQKLYNILYENNSKNKLPLEKAVRALAVREKRPYHRALDDALYTGEVMQAMQFDAVREFLSLDYYRLPKESAEEIYLVFPNYSKYVSREFLSREDAIADKTVTDMLCYRCNRMLRKKIRWFSANQRNYFCLAECPEHGYAKGKIRMRHAEDGGIYVVKTIKLVDEAGALDIEEKQEETLGRRRKKNQQKHRREKAKKKNAGLL